jgi:hypothetical protein
VLWDVFAADQMPILEASAPKLNVQLEKVEVRRQHDLKRAFRERPVKAVGRARMLRARWTIPEPASRRGA